MSVTTRNIIVLGDDRVGKTRYCASVLNMPYIEETCGYTMGMQVYDVQHRGMCRISLRDTGRGGLRSAYFIGVTEAVIIYKTEEDKARYEAEVRAYCGDIPISFIRSSDRNTEVSISKL